MNALDLFAEVLGRLNDYIKQQWGEECDILQKYSVTNYVNYVDAYAVPAFKNHKLKELIADIDACPVDDHTNMELNYWTTDDSGTWLPSLVACLPAVLIPEYIKNEDHLITKAQLVKILRYIEYLADIRLQ